MAVYFRNALSLSISIAVLSALCVAMGEQVKARPEPSLTEPFRISNTKLLFMEPSSSNAILKPLSVLPLPRVRTMALNPRTNRLYLGDYYHPQRLHVIDAQTDQLLTTQELLPEQVSGALFVNPLTDRLYVLAINGASTTGVCDLSTHQVLASVPFKTRDFPLYVDPSRNRIYLALTDTDDKRVIALDGKTHEVLATLSKVDALGIAGNPRTGLVYLAQPWARNVLVVDGETLQIRKTISFATRERPAVGFGTYERGPNWIAFNPTTNTIVVPSTTSDNAVSFVGSSGNSVAEEGRLSQGLESE